MLKKTIKIILSLIIALVVYALLPSEMGEAARRTAFIFVIAAIEFAWSGSRRKRSSKRPKNF